MNEYRYYKYAYISFLAFAKKNLLINVDNRAAFYLFYVLVGSIICDAFTPPNSFLASKHNYLNIYGVKIGWAWTFCLLASFILVITYKLSRDNIIFALKNFSRLIFATAIWYQYNFIHRYVCTSLFLFVQRTFGVCNINEMGYFMCRERGGEWTGLDISGHVFLLTYCQLLIGEECKLYSKPRDLKMLKTWDPFVKVNFILISWLSLVWEIMLFSTIIYYHTTLQKFSAVLIAVCGWFVTYKMFYQTGPGNLSPGLPESLSKYVKI